MLSKTEQAIAKLKAEGKLRPGQIAIIQMLHDDWCPVHAGGECQCEPDVDVIDLTPEFEQVWSTRPFWMR